MAWNHPHQLSPVKNSYKYKRYIGLALLLCVTPICALILFRILHTNNAENNHHAKTSKSGMTPKPTKISVAKNIPQSATEAIANLPVPPKTEIKTRQLTPEEWENMTNRPFKTTTEQILSWLVSVEPGDLPIPIPAIDEEEKRDLVSILISKNKVKETDDESIAFCKVQVDHAKKELAKYIGDGGDPDEFLQYYYKELRRAFEYRTEAVGQFQDLKEDSPEIAEEFRLKVNEKLEAEGIKPLTEEGY